MSINGTCYIKVIDGIYKGYRGYLVNEWCNEVVLYDSDCNRVLTTLKKVEYEVITPRVVG